MSEVRRPRSRRIEPATVDGRSRARDVDEFIVELYDELHGSVFRYLLCLGTPPESADDVIQETFLRLCTHLDKGGGAANLRAWVFRVAHNLATNERRNNRHFTLAGPSEWETLQDANSACQQDPEAMLLERERMVTVQRAIGTLSARELRCVHLRMEGLRYREIAEVLGVAISTVSEHLRRALAKLRRPPDA